MNQVGFLVILFMALSFIAAGAANAGEIQVMGSRKLNHPPRRSSVDVDDLIRAEEDPDFAKYVKEREIQKHQDRAAAIAYEKQRQADEQADEKAHRQYLKEEREKAAYETSKKKIHHADEQKAWEQEQEKLRKEYVRNQEGQIEKLNFERAARIQKAMSVQRLPASER